MILVDTSVWIEHLRSNSERLAQLLNDEQVLVHPFVIGELALGNLRHRERVLSDLRNMPRAPVATDDEVLRFIAQSVLPGSGIGYIDAHLLVAVRLAPGTALWTRDKRLLAISARLGLAAAGRS